MNLSKKTVRTIVLLLFIAALFFMIAQDPMIVPKAFFLLLSPFTPLLVGIGIALVLNVPMSFFESYFFRRKKGVTNIFYRALSLLLTYIILIGIIVLLIVFIVPSIRESLIDITANAANYVEKLRAILLKYGLPSNFLPNITSTGIEGIIQFIQTFLRVDENSNLLLSQITGYASRIINIAIDGVVGFVFSVYILMQKEKVIYFFSRFCHAILPEKPYRKLTEISKYTSATFSNFISGQLMHALLFGVLIQIALWIARIPYATLISCLIAIFALVPIVGAWLSAIIAVILILTISPFKALLFVIIYVGLQQLDDNFIYPRFVGKSIGLPGILVLLAVSVGSSVAGVLGMVVGVPVLAVAYHYLLEFIQIRLQKKQQLEMPQAEISDLENCEDSNPSISSKE